MTKHLKRLSKFLADADEQETFPKSELLEIYESNQKEITRAQVAYKKAVGHKFRTRRETLIEASKDHYIRKYQKERNDLKAKLYVAQGKTHTKQNDLHLKQIQCHVNCQDVLAKEIKAMRMDIKNVEREINRLNKENVVLQIKMKKTAITADKITREKRRLELLANQLEVSIRRECSYSAMNNDLRSKVIQLLHDRSTFNETYSLAIQQLNSGTKYFTEILEFAMNAIDNCIMAHERIEVASKKHSKELLQNKKEIQNTLHTERKVHDLKGFLGCKGKRRKLIPLEPKEVQRREKFREDHLSQIAQYREIMQKIVEYNKTNKIGQIINRYHEQESLYYSLFAYSNEMGHHLTFLYNRIDDLFANVEMLRSGNDDAKHNQANLRKHLQQMLNDKRKSNEVLKKEQNQMDRFISNICKEFDYLIKLTKCDVSSLSELLGENKIVNLVNLREVLQKFQIRLTDVISVVYITERNSSTEKQKLITEPTEMCVGTTPLEEIVITQQCAECAEGDAINMEDKIEVPVMSKAEVKKAFYEKVTQPELQYRLHSISQCRLPRSRMIAARRDL